MLNRVKHALVQSFVGAIALGYVLAQIIIHFVNIFASPIAAWIATDEYRRLVPQSLGSRSPGPTGFPFERALPELASFLLLLVIWFALLRWLYLPSITQDGQQHDTHVRG
jgi:hypothetical protein